MTFRLPAHLILAVLVVVGVRQAHAQQSRSREGLMTAVRTLAEKEAGLSHSAEVPDVATLHRQYIVRGADGRDSTIAGGKSVHLFRIMYFKNDTALVSLRMLTPGTIRRTHVPFVDEAKQLWRLVFHDGVWTKEMIQAITG